MSHHYARLYFVGFLSLLVINFSVSVKIGCKNEDGEDTDWYVNYKIPRLEKGYEGTNLDDGTAYAYMSRTGRWILSSESIASESSMLARTMHPVIHNKEKVTYLFYNDDPPAHFNGTSNGHLKVFVAFMGKHGFWLIHSIPKFGEAQHYKYPNNAKVNGQSILCVTFNITSLNEICNQLLHCSPRVYESQVTDEVVPFLDEKAQTLFSHKPAYNRRPPFKRISPLKSSGKQTFISFAKDGQFKEDVYSSVIAPELRISLATETWRRGSGGFLPPNCRSNYTVIDISKINMRVKIGRRNQDLSFLSTEDHSKWAVSTTSSRNWICVGDMNRMESQANRGGGALCFQSAKVRNAYNSLISDSDHCPV
ncbi:plancitoxin-1 [Caerostris extrusa]|uniref:Plancitoxin-1 n=1 Tax=Caerostris extrusa TaxID=172846 RepID=A0AAV4NZJ8_CAEEX|nr:plancitoxin-1 [Caerostris extrusa]